MAGEAEWAFTPKFYEEKGIVHDEEFITNSRGMKLYTCSWKPVAGEIKGLVFLLHGYAVESGLFFQETALKLVLSGYAVFGIDYEGHGRSDGPRALLVGLESVVKDFIAYSKTIKEKEEYSNKPTFLLGESLGGAVALLTHHEEPTAWTGAVLQAPMIKISDKLKPHPLVTSIMKKMAYYFPTWAIVPSKDVIDASNRDLAKRARVRNNPYTYTAKPRLATGLTFLNTCDDLQSQLDKVTIPFLVQHGDADTVTESAVSAELFEKAASADKAFKLYPGMWHSLSEGELDENVDIVMKDVIEWLDARSKPSE